MENVLIFISLSSVVDQSDHRIYELRPSADNEEIMDTTDRAVSLLLNSLLVSFDKRDTRLLGDCFQGLIDYLSYSGVSDAHAFSVVNKIEMELMSSLFSSVPFLENQDLIKIKEFKIFNRKDLVIYAKINKQHPSYSNPGPQGIVKQPSVVAGSVLYPV